MARTTQEVPGDNQHVEGSAFGFVSGRQSLQHLRPTYFNICGSPRKPPTWVLQWVLTSLENAAKGPWQWASAMDLWTLTEALGLHASFKNLEWAASAAKVRVVSFDKACLTSSGFRKGLYKLESYIRCPGDDCSIHRWHGWYDKAFSRVLAQTHDAVRDQAGSIEAIRVHRSATSVELKVDKLWRKQCHGAVYSFLVASKMPDPCQRVRFKMKR